MNDATFDRRLLAPRFWPAWVGVFCVYLLAHLPWSVQLLLGRFLGWLAWTLVGQRRSDTLVNLELCFPEWDEATRTQKAREVFHHAGISLFETANAWFIDPEKFRSRIRIEGLESLKAAEAQGRGVLLLGAHYSPLDLGGSLCSLFFKVDILYRPQNNAVFEYVVRKQRARIYKGQIDHDDMRGLLRALKRGDIVWYTPDQDYGLRQGVFAPFFGVEAATITATARLARSNQSPVMFIHFHRDADDRGYRILLTPVLEGYPSGDDVADATRVNQKLEELIRRAPTQYMWFHRRFKTRPAGSPMLYVKKRRQLREEREEAARAARKSS